MITDRAVTQAYSDLASTCGGVKEDYFGLLYLELEHGVPREKALNQTAFGGNDYAVDGFHFDEKRGNLYIYPYKYSDSHALFKGSLERLIDIGVERIFSAPNQDSAKNQILLQLRACLHRARLLLWALVCQGMLNDPDLEDYAETYGKTMALPAGYTEWITRIATTKARTLLSKLMQEPAYKEKVAEQNFAFLRTDSAFLRCMEVAYDKWGWVHKKLQ